MNRRAVAFAVIIGCIGWAAAAGAMVYGLTSNQDAIRAIERERIERTNQSCDITERKQADDVRKLRNTYDYLVGLTPRQRRTALNAAIIRQLPRTEEEARRDDAPAFCDEPGVGLPEPDPKLPRRPKSL